MPGPSDCNDYSREETMADKDNIREGKDFRVGILQLNKRFHVKAGGELAWG